MRWNWQRLGLGLASASLTQCGVSERAGPGGPTVQTTTGELPARVEALATAMSQPMYDCPERLWPGTANAFRRSQVLLVSESSSEAFLWNDRSASGTPPVTTLVDIDALGAEWFSSFNIGTLNSRPTLGVSLDDTAAFNSILGGWQDYALVLALHEGFHFLTDQLSWKVDAGGRSIPYPEEVLPRYLRAELIQALRTELETGNALSAAAHWQQRFMEESPAAQLKIRGTDVLEGTAEYVSVVGGTLAELGCDATDAELHSLALAHLEESTANLTYDGAGEAYILGVLAGLILRREGVTGWYGAAEIGTPPVESLLTGAPTEAQAEDPALLADVTTVVEQRNAYYASEVDELLARMASTEYYRVPVASHWGQGSFGTNGFLQLQNEPGQPEVTLNLQASLIAPSSNVTVTVNGLTVVQQASAAPCSDAFGAWWILTVPKASLVESNGLYSIDETSLAFTNLPARTVTEAGLDWLCPSGS